MKKVLMMAVTLMFCGAIVMAEDAKPKKEGKKGGDKKPEVTVVVGKVEIKKDEAGAVTEINIVGKDGEKTVVTAKDDAVKEAIVKLDGKEVEIKATKKEGKLIANKVTEKGAEVKKEEPKKEEPKKEEAAPAAPKAEHPAHE